MDALNLRHSLDEAEDIHGMLLHTGDIVRITVERLARFPSYVSRVGELLVITEIYTMPHVYGDDKLGALQYIDGSGSIWNSLLNLYEKTSEAES